MSTYQFWEIWWSFNFQYVNPNLIVVKYFNNFVIERIHIHNQCGLFFTTEKTEQRQR
jgi:hypothetical protein